MYIINLLNVVTWRICIRFTKLLYCIDKNRCDRICCSAYFHIIFRFDCMFRLRFAGCQNFRRLWYHLRFVSWMYGKGKREREKKSNRTNVITLSIQLRKTDRNISHCIFLHYLNIADTPKINRNIQSAVMCVVTVFVVVYFFLYSSRVSLPFANIIGQWHFTRAKFWLSEWDSVCFLPEKKKNYQFNSNVNECQFIETTK